MTLWRILMGLAVTVSAVAMVSCQARTDEQSPRVDGQTVGIDRSDSPEEEADPLARERRSATEGGEASPPGEQPPMEGQAVRAEHLLPLHEQTQTFRVIDGENLDERLTLALRPTRGEEPGEWVLEFSDLNTLYLSVAPEGDVMIVRLDLPPEDMAVVYDPPVRMLPAEIRPHEQVEEQSVARVYDIESGELEHTGDVEHTLHFARRSEFATDVGVWDGYLIPIEHRIDIPWVDVRLDLAGGYVPEVGIVYRRMDYTRTAAGVFGETQRRAAVLTED